MSNDVAVHKAVQELVAYLPCVECGGEFRPNQLQFTVEGGHAVHRCYACAAKTGRLKSLDYADQSIAEEQALFEEMTQSDPAMIAEFAKQRFGPGAMGLKAYADFAISQSLIAASTKPGSRVTLEYLRFIHKIFTEGAKDRRAEESLVQRSDDQLKLAALELLAKATIKKESEQPNSDSTGKPAVARLGLDQPFPGGEGPTPEALGRADTEAAREPQPVGTPA